jgi:hypothetical protein
MEDPMRLKSHILPIAAFTALASFSPAHANELGHDPSCPNGEVLSTTGTGQVLCVNPTPGVNVSCPKGHVLSGIAHGAPVCVPAPSAVQRVSTTIGEVNAHCGFPADPNPPLYNQLQYNTTCASRFCASVYGDQLGILTENGPTYILQRPWDSDPQTAVSIACVR